MVKTILTFILLSLIGCNHKENCDKELKYTLRHVTFYLPNCYKIHAVKNNPNEFFIVKNDTIKLEISLDGAVTSDNLKLDLGNSLVFIDTINNCRRTISHFKDEYNSTQFNSMIIELDEVKTNLSLFKEFSHIVKFNATSQSGLSDEDIKIFTNSFKNLKLNV